MNLGDLLKAGRITLKGEANTTMTQDITQTMTPLLAPSLSAEEIRAIETLYRAFDDKDPALLDEVLTPGWEDTPLVPGQAPGPQGLKDQFPMFFGAFPDLKVVVHEVMGGQGRVGVRASLTGTHRGEIFGVAPTGLALEIPIHEFHHLQDGRITHTWHMEDWFGMLNRIGAWPPASAIG